MAAGRTALDSSCRGHYKPSIDALKAYSAAWTVAFTKGPPAAIPLLRRALEIDPDFAMAHAFMGLGTVDMGETVLSTTSMTRAFELRGRASDKERFFIEMYYRQVAGNLEKAHEAATLWAHTYPRDASLTGSDGRFRCQRFRQSTDCRFREAGRPSRSTPTTRFPTRASLSALSTWTVWRTPELRSWRASQRSLEVPDYTRGAFLHLIPQGAIARA